MKLLNIEDYLSDKKFDEGLKVNFLFDDERISRIDKITKICTSKNIIHVGCVDHVPLINEKIKNNTWLHKLLTDASINCLGVDINDEGIQFLKKLGYKNVYTEDLMNPSKELILNKKWDLMVLGEILEHVDNPCDFLKNLKKIYSNNVSQIIISVPNAFCYYNFKNMLSNFEMINSDHRSTFTPYTLNKILHIAGFKLDEIFFVDPIYKFHHKVVNKLLNKKLLSVHPGLSNTLLAIASFNS